MKKLTVKEAEALMRRYLKDYPRKIFHSIKVSKLAYDVAKRINERHPELKIDLKEIRILGLLHDIGRGTSKGWIDHTFESGNLLRKLGYPEIAKKIEKHDPSHEIARYLKIKGYFIPKLIEEKILIYADSHYKHNKLITVSERVKIGKESIKRKYPQLIPLFDIYNKRRMKIIKEIERLMK